MKSIVDCTGTGWDGQTNQQWRFQILKSGSRMFLEATKMSPNYDSEDCFTVELCRDERKVQVNDAILGHPGVNDLFRQMAEMTKNAQGMRQPKFDSGDVVMVDKAGSHTVKVIDPFLQTSETFEKKQVIVEKEECNCSLKTLMQLGCARKRGAAGCEF